ncbi:predicted protein [Histoplasma capsulatum G186AR]|uniref:Uncharacterized protein n=1 Tax=Ajellomyces capsulatus (strain G186AR / H82 / ATCC MYA-2454 / RMSCC 2432) TaxID=447093 RepID=C0NEI3_AJECG|nr:uncharacterized protein HCBG_01299 [Histoplasma capsulatum G186AR]EEH09654.1 predicted protein [Histoplasma capsulatum G186AR]
MARGWTVGGFMSAYYQAQPGGLSRARRILDCSGRHRELCPSLQGNWRVDWLAITTGQGGPSSSPPFQGHISLKLFQGAILRGNDEVSAAYAECHLSPKSPLPIPRRGAKF